MANGRKPSCLCGECKTCKRRAYVTDLRYRTGYGRIPLMPPRVSAKSTSDFKPEVVRAPEESLDDFALKWLHSKGFR